MYYEDIIKWNKYNLSNNVLRILLVVYKNYKNDIETETRMLKFCDNIHYFTKKGAEQGLFIITKPEDDFQKIALTEYGFELSQALTKYLEKLNQ